MTYKPTIGLEIHVELKTKTKMFCGCFNNPDEKTPNVNICPICTAHPGCLPTINKEAVEKVLKVGIALNGSVGNISKFDRKNYFYPDLPKAYQISQYDKPFIYGGALNNIRITRVHLEEDTARLVHATNNQPRFLRSRQPTTDDNYSLVDFNRSGIPLMELVTEPDIKSGKEAVKFAKELQLILRYLDISDADMEKGHMRVEANISLREIAEQRGTGAEQRENNLGTKAEIKNLNSFRAVGDAIDFEIKRQEEILGKGGKVVQETRGWDENKKQTFSQRLKEEAHDYRYFPEPDLPPIDFSGTDFDLQKIKNELQELPAAKRNRFQSEYGLSAEQADILAENKQAGGYFEEAVSEMESFGEKNIQLLYNYFISDLKGLMNEKNVSISELKINAHEFAHLIYLISSGRLTSRLAKDLLREMFESGEDPETILKQKGLDGELSGEAINKIINEIIAANKKAVEDYKKGQENALQFLIGQAMAKLKGRISPEKLKELFKSKLK